MAVQKSRKTPSRRGMRRSHDALTAPTVSEESATGETHRATTFLPKVSPRPPIVDVAPEFDEEAEENQD